MASGSSFTADEVLQLALTEENDDILPMKVMMSLLRSPEVI